MNCPVCSAKEKSFLFTAYDILYCMTDNKFTLLKCENCSALYILPFPTQKETETFYPKNYYSYEVITEEGFFEKLKRKIIQSKVGDKSKLTIFDRILITIFQSKFSGVPLYRKEKGKFLDIGCGTGKNLSLVKEYGWEVYGLELDERAVLYAQSKGLNVNQDSLESFDSKDMKFDCIRIWHVFEHLTDPHVALEKMRMLLTSEGEILMAVPNAMSFARIIFGRYWYGLDVPRHVIHYSPQSLRVLCKYHNLQITNIRYASCGSFIASISNFLRREFGYQGNLINNTFLVFLFSPLDYMSDLFHMGDTIFLKIRKNG